MYRKKVPDPIAGLPAIGRYSVGLGVVNQQALQLSIATTYAGDAGVYTHRLGLLPDVVKLRPSEREILQNIWAQSHFTQESGVAKAFIPLDLLVRTFLP